MPAAPRTEATLLDEVTLEGRKAELRQLLKALTLCRTGQGKAILLTGNEGIGKTALLDTFLTLAQDPLYDSITIRVQVPHRPTMPEIFTRIVDQILTHSRNVLQEALTEANQVLAPIGLQWSHNDLMRVIALIGLQTAVGNTQQLAQDQLARLIYDSLPFFKRMNPNLRTQIDQLARVLLSSRVMLAASLVNPINPQVQQAIQLAKEATGISLTPMLPGGSTMANGSMPLLSGATAETTESADVPNTENMPDEAAIAAFEAQEANTAPAAPNFAVALQDLLRFINAGMRSGQSAFVLALDGLDTLAQSSQAERKATGELLTELVRNVVDQRDTRLMLLVTVRSETLSYTLGGPLFNALKVKYLVPPLTPLSQQRLLKAGLKDLGINAEDPVIEAIVDQTAGNPGWLMTVLDLIRTEQAQTPLTLLDMDTYQARFAVRQPQEMLELLFSRLQLAFVGQESAMLKALNAVLNGLGTDTFTQSRFIQILAAKNHSAELGQHLWDSLLQYGFLQAATTAVPSPDGQRYQFTSAFRRGELEARCRPLQDDLPAPDKVASLKKVLPLAIQSGELTRQKTQELLAMAQALENQPLLDEVSETLLNALTQPEVPELAKVGILESLPLLMTPAALEALREALSSPEARLRETACQQWLPLIPRSGLPIARSHVVDSILPLTEDPAQPVQYLAYQLLALALGETERVLPTLMAGTQHQDATIRMLCLTGLVHHHATGPEILALYKSGLSATTDASVRKLLLRGLSQFDHDVVVATLKDFLTQHAPDSPGWLDALMQLYQMSLAEALPWIQTLMSQPLDGDTQLQILKRLGAKPNPECERILINVLASPVLAPELRWMAIRSLGRIGQSHEAISCLQEQAPLCQRDEILVQSLKTAIRDISERLSPFVSPQPYQNGQTNGHSPLSSPAYTNGNTVSNALDDFDTDLEDEEEEADTTVSPDVIDLVTTPDH